MSAQKKPKAFFYLIGWALVVGGISLILLWWPEVVLLFKAVIGMILAFAGLLILYFQKQQ